MTKHTFKAGDRVRRINHDNNSVVRVGTEWTVASDDNGWLDLKETKHSGGASRNFELVVPAKKPQPNLKANFSIPREIITEAAKAYVKEVYGVTLVSAQLSYDTAPVPLHAEIKAA
ncbi:hypothetical protein [Brucella pituitosa]|uniref:hypothetical protein n=1 Tax=Brucella pituitosa TaxID=571256 RepID=UPI0009A202DA|nr:hypothetical protein [Brucella pituitosa]